MSRRPDGTAERTDGRFAVLDVFGLTLEVSNPRLAELLTMDASAVMSMDVRDLLDADRRSVVQAIPDAVVSVPTPRDREDERARAAFRLKADALGRRLGFAIEPDGTWVSPTGIDIVTRTIPRSLTVAAAAHYVNEVAVMTERLPENAAVLFVVADQRVADVFKVAIRQRRVFHRMRTAAVAALEEAAALLASGVIVHRDVLLLLAPVANIDVGEMMSVFGAAEDGATGADAAAGPTDRPAWESEEQG